LKDEDIKKVFTEADKDKDNKLIFEEFKVAIEEAKKRA